MKTLRVRRCLAVVLVSLLAASPTSPAQARQQIVSHLAIDSGRPTTVYAVTSDGVIKSSDAGLSWLAANAGLPARR